MADPNDPNQFTEELPQGVQPQQPPAQQPNPYDQAAQAEWQRYQANALPPAQGGAVKPLLSNFISGLSYGMTPPQQNPDFLRQQALTNMVNLSNASANLGLKQAQTQEQQANAAYRTQSLQLLQEQIEEQSRAPLTLEQATAIHHPEMVNMRMRI